MEGEKLNSFIQHYKAERQKQKMEKLAKNSSGDGVIGFIASILIMAIVVAGGGMFFSVG